MTMEQLRALYQARPFRPFTLQLADGDKLRVPHADFLSHSPTGRTIIVFGEDESFSIVDRLPVTRVVVQNGVPATHGGE